VALKRHDGESDHFRIELPDESRDRLSSLALNQDQIRHGHAVVRINIARE
jgi:predicted transcriptional regulator